MLIELPWAWIVALNVAGWLIVQVGLAWAFTRMPVTWFDPSEPRFTEDSGSFHERFLAIKRWKGWLPDGARWFAGGFAKGALAATDPLYLRRFICETRRGELCHWVAVGCAPIFFLWNPWWGDLIIVTYALAANLPCILTQRYNRARFSRLLRRVSLGRQNRQVG